MGCSMFYALLLSLLLPMAIHVSAQAQDGKQLADELSNLEELARAKVEAIPTPSPTLVDQVSLKEAAPARMNPEINEFMNKMERQMGLIFKDTAPESATLPYKTNSRKRTRGL